jgi:hypothetical protein
MFLTTFQGTFSSFMAFSVLNKEKIASLPRSLEAQEREEKEKKNHKRLRSGAEPRIAAQWRRVLAPWRRHVEKPYKYIFNSEKRGYSF